MLFLIVLTQVNDVVQYLISIYLGKRKLKPSANPIITWEGFVGAVIVTTFASFFIYPYLTPLDLKFGILSGILIIISGFFGILTISVLTRDFLIPVNEKPNAKESYLSRVDSLTYTAPVFFLVIRYF